MELWLSVFILAATLWLLARSVRQYGALASVQVAAPPTADAAPEIAVVVPARNEADNIGPVLESLTAQNYPAERLTFLAVDDDSQDGTGALIERLARRDARVRALRAETLRPGWTGKCQACWAGAQAAPLTAQWLCFVDADVRAKPELFSSAVAAAGELDLLSLSPRQTLVSFAERLMIPCGLYLLSFRHDVAKLHEGRGDEVTATGQFLMIRRDVYASAGGHSAVRGEICEDLELARRVKRAGGRVRLMDGSRVLSTRMYHGWSDLWPGFAKNVVEMFGGPAPTLMTALAAFALSVATFAALALDVTAALAGAPWSRVALVLAGVNAAIVVGFHVAGSIFLGIPPGFGLLFPLGYALGALIAADGVWRRRFGGVTWKGRRYP
jgi:chlorobactene glucosyltransferase